MRRIERFALFFGIFNLALGVLSLFAPFVKQPASRKLLNRLPMRRSPARGIINTGPGMLFGQLGAVNPPHSIVHSILGIMGLATLSSGRLSRPYMWLNAALFAAMAGLGWANTGLKPGIKNVMGFAMDRNGNFVSTLMAATAALLAARPNLFSGNETASDTVDMVSAGLLD
jgi:hypothetical protein